MRANTDSERLLAEEYRRWTADALNTMGEALEAFSANGGDVRELVDTVFGVAHNIKGMGSTFGYPLMTQIGTSLCDYLREWNSSASAALAVIEAHFKSMRVVFDNEISGDGGENGQRLVARLAEIITENS